MTTEAVVAVVTLAGTIVVSTTAILVLLFKTWRQASDANDAINHKHTDQPRAFDMIVQIHQGHGKLMGYVEDLQRWAASLDNRQLVHQQSLTRLEASLNELKEQCRK